MRCADSKNSVHFLIKFELEEGLMYGFINFDQESSGGGGKGEKVKSLIYLRKTEWNQLKRTNPEEKKWELMSG